MMKEGSTVSISNNYWLFWAFILLQPLVYLFLSHIYLRLHLLLYLSQYNLREPSRFSFTPAAGARSQMSFSTGRGGTRRVKNWNLAGAFPPKFWHLASHCEFSLKLWILKIPDLLAIISSDYRTGICALRVDNVVEIFHFPTLQM